MCLLYKHMRNTIRSVGKSNSRNLNQTRVNLLLSSCFYCGFLVTNEYMYVCVSDTMFKLNIHTNPYNVIFFFKKETWLGFVPDTGRSQSCYSLAPTPKRTNCNTHQTHDRAGNHVSFPLKWRIDAGSATQSVLKYVIRCWHKHTREFKRFIEKMRVYDVWYFKLEEYVFTVDWTARISVSFIETEKVLLFKA